jgi:hypothetical protein
MVSNLEPWFAFASSAPTDGLVEGIAHFPAEPRMETHVSAELARPARNLAPQSGFQVPKRLLLGPNNLRNGSDTIHWPYRLGFYLCQEKNCRAWEWRAARWAQTLSGGPAGRALQLFVKFARRTGNKNPAGDSPFAIFHPLYDPGRLAAFRAIGALRRIHHLLTVCCLCNLDHGCLLPEFPVAAAQGSELEILGSNLYGWSRQLIGNRPPRVMPGAPPRSLPGTPRQPKCLYSPESILHEPHSDRLAPPHLRPPNEAQERPGSGRRVSMTDDDDAPPPLTEPQPIPYCRHGIMLTSRHPRHHHHAPSAPVRVRH